eukprot:1713237-Pyramimonas_sp.AAC.1
MELMAIPAIFFISLVLLGVEEIGVQLEEPVSLLDLEGMVEDIRRDVDEACAAREAIQTEVLGKKKSALPWRQL